jgi:hypothetical protein
MKSIGKVKKNKFKPFKKTSKTAENQIDFQQFFLYPLKDVLTNRIVKRTKRSKNYKRCITLKNYKKISAALLATGLIASTSIQVFANDTEKVDTTNFETVNLQDALNNVKNESTSVEDLQLIVANIPAGLTANNIFALSTNIEKITNPQAKSALKKNLEKAISKYEEKNTENSTTEIPVVVENDTEVEKTVPATEETESEKTEKKVAHDLKKAERETAKEAQKAAKLLENQEQKAEKQAKKQERKTAQQAKKAEHTQQVKKEERKATKKVEKEERKASQQVKKEERKALHKVEKDEHTAK